MTRNHTAERNAAREQQQAATHDQCDIEPGERQEATLIGIAGLSSCGVAAATGTRDTRGTTALCNLSRRPASLTAVTGLGKRGGRQGENSDNGCEDADSSN